MSRSNSSSSSSSSIAIQVTVKTVHSIACMHLFALGGSAIDHSRAQACLVGELARLLIDLICELTRGAHDKRFGICPPAV